MKYKPINFLAILSLLFLSMYIKAQTPEGFSWQEVKSVDFGDGVNHFTIKTATSGLGGELELRLD